MHDFLPSCSCDAWRAANRRWGHRAQLPCTKRQKTFVYPFTAEEAAPLGSIVYCSNLLPLIDSLCGFLVLRTPSLSLSLSLSGMRMCAEPRFVSDAAPNESMQDDCRHSRSRNAVFPSAILLAQCSTPHSIIPKVIDRSKVSAPVQSRSRRALKAPSGFLDRAAVLSLTPLPSLPGVPIHFRDFGATAVGRSSHSFAFCLPPSLPPACAPSPPLIAPSPSLEIGGYLYVVVG